MAHYPYRPPNQRPFAPSFEQLQLARKTKEAKDKETQGLLKHSEPSLNPPASAAAAAKLEIPEGTFVLTYEKLESEVVIQSVQDDAAGAIAVFIGTTRDSFQGTLNGSSFFFRIYGGYSGFQVKS